MESFNGQFRDEFLNIELFASLAVAKVLAEQHRIAYNVYRPHSLSRGLRPRKASSNGSHPAMEGGLITPTAPIRTGATKGVTSPGGSGLARG